MNSKDQYWVTLDGQTVVGPMTFGDLCAMWARGQIGVTAQISTGGEWVPVAGMAEVLERGATAQEEEHKQAGRMVSPVGVLMGLVMAILGGAWLWLLWGNVDEVRTADGLTGVTRLMPWAIGMIMLGLVVAMGCGQRRK